MKSKKTLSLILILVLVIGFANADVIKKQVEIITGDLKVFLNGKELYLTDFNNKKVEPIMYNGELYLPVSATAKALGLDILYDSIENSVILGSQNVNYNKPDAYLQDLTIIRGTKVQDFSKNHKSKIKKEWPSIITDQFNHEYEDYMFGFPSNLTFKLADKYQEFACDIIYREGFEKDKTAYKMEFYVNDKLVFTSKNFMSGSLPEHISLTLNMADKLEIKTYSQETKNYVVDETKWDNTKNAFQTRALAIVNPYLYLK